MKFSRVGAKQTAETDEFSTERRRRAGEEESESDGRLDSITRRTMPASSSLFAPLHSLEFSRFGTLSTVSPVSRYRRHISFARRNNHASRSCRGSVLVDLAPYSISCLPPTTIIAFSLMNTTNQLPRDNKRSPLWLRSTDRWIRSDWIGAPQFQLPLVGSLLIDEAFRLED